MTTERERQKALIETLIEIGKMEMERLHNEGEYEYTLSNHSSYLAAVAIQSLHESEDALQRVVDTYERSLTDIRKTLGLSEFDDHELVIDAIKRQQDRLISAEELLREWVSFFECDTTHDPADATIGWLKADRAVEEQLTTHGRAITHAQITCEHEWPILEEPGECAKCGLSHMVWWFAGKPDASDVQEHKPGCAALKAPLNLCDCASEGQNP